MPSTKKQKQKPERRLHIDRRADQVADYIAGDDADPDESFSTTDAAKLLGVSVPWMEDARHNGYGPPYVRLAPRLVRYRRSDLVAWLRERTHRSTAEYAEPRKRA